MNSPARIVRLLEPAEEPKPRLRRGRTLYLGSARLGERMARLGWELASGKTITTDVIRRMFRVSKATAKRDLVSLERALRIVKEHARGCRTELRAPERIEPL